MSPESSERHQCDRFATPVGSLAVHRFAAGPVRWVALHGFTLGGPSWAATAHHLPGTTLAPDLPGHGDTDVSPIDLAATVTALTGLLAVQPSPPVLIGYSQGGRLAMHVALAEPAMVSGLVMVSAAAGLAATERAGRAVVDLRTAEDIQRMGVATFIDRWLEAPLTGTGHLDAATAEQDRSIRLRNTATGLAAALRGLGQGVVPRIDPRSMRVPSLWIAGTDDETYRRRLRTDAAAAGGRYVTVAGGHNVVLENPATVAGAIVDWMRAFP